MEEAGENITEIWNEFADETEKNCWETLVSFWFPRMHHNESSVHVHEATSALTYAKFLPGVSFLGMMGK